MSVFVQPLPPYDFTLTAQASRSYCIAHQWHDEALWRVLRIGGGLALARVTSSGTTDAPSLHAEIVATSGAVDEVGTAASLRHWLALDSDMRPFYAAVQGDAPMMETVARLRGLHILRTDTLFEALMVTIIEQQIALSAAQKAERWLLHTYGERIHHDGHDYYAFPTAETIASLSIEAMTPLKITFIRMRRMIAIAQAIADGRLDLEALRHQPPEISYRALVALNGIGHWTAAWTMIRALGVFLYVGSADVALRAAVNHYWRGERGRASRDDTDTHFATYGTYAGLASVYTLMRWAFDRYPLE
ncbi:MAG: hypothetical protein SF123_18100 [Chloroflexota bacterium]|nr:hypothetical protein [Chloroflexota bacterium]